MFICAIGVLGLVGERLRKISEKHHEIARAGFRKLFRSQVSSAFPYGLNNAAGVVLAYRAVWEECFNVPGAKNIEGWKLRNLCERVRLIHFLPIGRSDSTAHCGRRRSDQSDRHRIHRSARRALWTGSGQHNARELRHPDHRNHTRGSRYGSLKSDEPSWSHVHPLSCIYLHLRHPRIPPSAIGEWS